MQAKEFFEIATDKAKQKVLDHYKDWEVYDSWYEFTIDDFKQSNKHFDVTKVYFSGFWSQGDGAMFEYNGIKQTLIDEFFKSLDFLKPIEIKLFNKFFIFNSSGFHRGFYYHENTCMHQIQIDTIKPLYSQHTCISNFLSKLESDFEDFLIKKYKEQACELYRTLEKEYNYLTSDEIIKEGLIDNEVDIEYDIEEDEVYITTRRRL